MRISHVVALIGVIVLGLVVKAFVLPVGKVAAGVRPAVAMDIMQIQRHAIARPPAQAMRDMTFVFDDGVR
jgi:hypothetical protein